MKDFWLREFDALARYNAEKARGIMHTPEYSEVMRNLQLQYNERLANFNAAQQSARRAGLQVWLSKAFGWFARQ